MRYLAVFLVFLACGAMIVLAVTEGLSDVTGVVLLALLLLTGALLLAALQRVGTGDIRPRSCPQCSDLNSRQAPYCKHCGALLDHSIEV